MSPSGGSTTIVPMPATMSPAEQRALALLEEAEVAAGVARGCGRRSARAAGRRPGRPARRRRARGRPGCREGRAAPPSPGGRGPARRAAGAVAATPPTWSGWWWVSQIAVDPPARAARAPRRARAPGGRSPPAAASRGRRAPPRGCRAGRRWWSPPAAGCGCASGNITTPGRSSTRRKGPRLVSAGSTQAGEPGLRPVLGEHGEEVQDRRRRQHLAARASAPGRRRARSTRPVELAGDHRGLDRRLGRPLEQEEAVVEAQPARTAASASGRRRSAGRRRAPRRARRAGPRSVRSPGEQGPAGGLQVGSGGDSRGDAGGEQQAGLLEQLAQGAGERGRGPGPGSGPAPSASASGGAAAAVPSASPRGIPATGSPASERDRPPPGKACQPPMNGSASARRTQ